MKGPQELPGKAEVIDLDGAPYRDRTYDQLINRPAAETGVTEILTVDVADFLRYRYGASEFTANTTTSRLLGSVRLTTCLLESVGKTYA